VFVNAGMRREFKTGDSLLVAAGVEHCSENFTEDFSIWTIFDGPHGGELKST
jgi:uncharacterized protein YjlB